MSAGAGACVVLGILDVTPEHDLALLAALDRGLELHRTPEPGRPGSRPASGPRTGSETTDSETTERWRSA